MENNTQLPVEVLKYKAGAAEYYMQHNYRELYGLLQNIFELAEKVVKETRTWYTDKEMYNHLRLKGYSHEIAEELSNEYASNLQGAYQKGLQHAEQEIATKLHQVETCNGLLKTEAKHLNGVIDKLQQENAELRRQNDKMKQQATGWRPLLEEVLSKHETGGCDLLLMERIKTFLYGE